VIHDSQAHTIFGCTKNVRDEKLGGSLGTRLSLTINSTAIYYQQYSVPLLLVSHGHYCMFSGIDIDV